MGRRTSCIVIKKRSEASKAAGELLEIVGIQLHAAKYLARTFMAVLSANRELFLPCSESVSVPL